MARAKLMPGGPPPVVSRKSYPRMPWRSSVSAIPTSMSGTNGFRPAQARASFQSSGRTHFHYMRHPHTRGETELTLDCRGKHLEEMYVA